MNAILIMPPKFLAVFWKREKMRRHSFSQPIRRSMILRSRYASRSNVDESLADDFARAVYGEKWPGSRSGPISSRRRFEAIVEEVRLSLHPGREALVRSIRHFRVDLKCDTSSIEHLCCDCRRARPRERIEDDLSRETACPYQTLD